MSTMPPSLSVTVNTKRRACVIDTTLALSRYGLLLTQRLGDEFDLWLARELWQILDNTQYYLSHPESLTPVPSGNQNKFGKYCSKTNETRHFLQDILNQWDMARMQTDLASLKIYWIGDVMGESLLPTGVNQHVIHRYEVLARSLDARRRKSDCMTQNDSIFADCFRDAVALSAALIPHKGFILTRQGMTGDELSEAEPIICSYLRKWEIPCYRIGMEQKIEIEKAFLLPIFARAAITELMYTGLKLVVVHICVPDAIIMPFINREEDVFEEEVPPLHTQREADSKDWWKNAVCFWYPF